MVERAALPHRAFPCDECPFRMDNAENPAAKFPAERWAALAVTVRNLASGRQPMPGDAMFGCHKGAPGTNADLACAGWLARFGADHVGVRLTAVRGRLPYRALEPGANWPALYDTWDDAVRAQTTPRRR